MSAGRPHGWRTALLAGLIVAGCSTLLAVARPTPAAAQGCGPAPDGRVAVVVVVDDGGGGTSQRCVEAAQSDTGYDVLVAAGHTLRIESGFLCAIDGVPATGCGNRPDFGGAYWRYFHAAPGGAWAYATVGGGGYRMPPRCAVEGWRFATSSSDAITPRIAPPQVACEAPSATPPTTAAPATGPPAGSGAEAVVGVPGAGPPADPSGATTTVASAGVAEGGTEGGAAGAAGATSTDPGAEVRSEVADRVDPTARGDAVSSDGSDVTSSEPVGSGGPPAVGLVIGLLLIAVLVAGAVRTARSRRKDPPERFLPEGP